MKIRNATPDDVENLVNLLFELGYRLSNQIMEKNIFAYGNADEYEVLVWKIQYIVYHPLDSMLQISADISNESLV